MRSGEDPSTVPATVGDVRRVNSWKEFLEQITDTPLSNWAFRGQADAAWGLRSTLARYLSAFGVDPRAWPDQERRIVRIFKRKAHLFLDHVPDPDDDLQWLALMQHHGAPTRLLDLTWSPYVAAFFALERAVGDSAVWAINAPGIMQYGPYELDKGVLIDPQRISPSERGRFETYYLKGEIPFVWVGEPLVMNRRLIAQSGTFAVPGSLSAPMEELLAGYPGHQTVVKIVLPAEQLRDQGMRELYRMNITHATLFPDLDGLARSLAYELEYHWAYDPRTLKRLT